MKRIILMSIAGLICVMTSSCKKFLEESSLDEIKPSTIKELNQLMSGEAYPYETNLHMLLNIVSDDVGHAGGQGFPAYETIVRKGRSAYVWSKEMTQELPLEGLSNSAYVNSWKIIYQRIAGCNVILSYIDKVSGDAAEKENMRGQALAMRAYYYFVLVNLYGKPYNDPSSLPTESLGVPLKLDMEVSDEFYARNTVAEVYAQIEGDFKIAAVLLTNNPIKNGPYKMSAAAAYAMLSRIYLYKEDWDQCILYADKALAIKSSLMQFMNFDAAKGYYVYNNGFLLTSPIGMTYNRIYDASRSTEVIWSYSPLMASEDEFFPTAMSPGFSIVNKPPYGVSSELLALYESYPISENEKYIGDIRSRLYYNSSLSLTVAGGALVYYYTLYKGGKGALGLRTAELYLNRAEANIRKFLISGEESLRLAALVDINGLRASRYDTRKPYVAITISDADALYAFYQDERRRELSFEGHRWFDLRRYGMPSITHRYEEVAGTAEDIVLQKGDSRYTFQIPFDALTRNPALVQNP